MPTKTEKRKFALVTGASRGIGKAIALQLAADLNYSILVNYHSNSTKAQAVVSEIISNGGHAEALQFDVADLKMTQDILKNWQDSNPDALVEVIVNNAGTTKDGLFLWMPESDWHSVINTSLNGFYNVTNTLLKPLLTNRYGRIINIVSLAGLKGNPGQVNYSAAKGAVVAATKALAQEIGKRKVTVNAVAPGFIETDMTENIEESKFKEHIPANRFGRTEEVAHLVSFLASKKASYITGEVININGGLYS